MFSNSFMSSKIFKYQLLEKKIIITFVQRYLTKQEKKTLPEKMKKGVFKNNKGVLYIENMQNVYEQFFFY